MIIDYTFFQDGLLQVEGAMALAAPSPTNEGIAHRIESFIEQYEPEYLCKLLGEELHEDFLDNGDSALWEEFKGMLVTDNGITKVSPIANYVYFFLVRNGQDTATVNGVRKDGENLVSPQRKMVWAWNDMVQRNRKLYKWLCMNFRNVQTEQEMLETINEFNV